MQSASSFVAVRGDKCPQCGQQLPYACSVSKSVIRVKHLHYCHQHIRKPLRKPFAAVADKGKYLPPNCNRAIATFNFAFFQITSIPFSRHQRKYH